MEDQDIGTQNKRYRNPKIWINAQRVIEVVQRKK